MKIAAVVPTVEGRNQIQVFVKEWEPYLKLHNVDLFIVMDGDLPYLIDKYKKVTQKSIMGDYEDLIFNRHGCSKNLGFAYAYKNGYDIIMTFDDDTRPLGDTIADHLNALDMRVPISWFAIGSEYTRGFPYAVRSEAEVVLSHGVWVGNPDYDAPLRLISGNPQMTYYKGAIPKGALYPMSGMNIAFKRKLMPAIYQSPAGHRVGFARFDDIWGGIESKWEIDKQGWAAVTGYATVKHQQASNVFNNLVQEAKGIKLNETFWKGDMSDSYFKVYTRAFKRWKEFCKKYD